MPGQGVEILSCGQQGAIKILSRGDVKKIELGLVHVWYKSTMISYIKGV